MQFSIHMGGATCTAQIGYKVTGLIHLSYTEQTHELAMIMANTKVVALKMLTGLLNHKFDM